MRRPPSAPLFVLAVALAAFAWRPAEGRATVVEALDLEELVGASESIGVGVALSAQPRRDGRRIVTDTVIELEERWKGSGGARVTLTTLGGAIDGVGMRVPGAGRIPVGARAVVFAARRQSASNGLRPVGMGQGILPVRNEGGIDMVHPGGRGLAMVRRVQGGQLVHAPGALVNARPLDELREEVRALVGRGAR